MAQEIKAGEYNEEEELRNKLLPRLYFVEKDKQLVMKSEKFEMYDLFLRAPDTDKILSTFLMVTIEPECQLKPFTASESFVSYMIIEGHGFVASSDLTKRIEAGMMFDVKQGVHHNIINTDQKQKLKFTMNYAGYLDFRDFYKPFSQATIREKQSKEQLIKQTAAQRQSDVFRSAVPPPVKEKDKDKKPQPQPSNASDVFT